MRADRRFGLARLLVAALVTLPATLAAQEALERRRVFPGAEFRTLSFDAGLGTKSVSEVVVPIGVVWPISRRVTLDVGTRYARATRTDETQSSASISGLTDLQARAVIELRPDVLVFTVAANLPTGKTGLTAAELPVAGVIASDLIPFPVSSFGSGFNVTSGLAVALPVAGWALGLAGSYRMSGEYTPLADTSASYQAGGEVRFRIGLERIIAQGRVSVGFTYSSFATDEFGGSEVFRPGSRYISQASWSFPIGNLGFTLYGWDLYRSTGFAPISQAAIEKQNIFTLGASATLQLGRNILRPMIEYRRHTEGLATLEPAGRLLSLGARYQMALGERFVLLPSLRFDTGSIASAGTDVGFRGLSVGALLRTNL